MFSKWISTSISQIKIRNYQRRFLRLKSKNNFAANEEERAKIKSKIETLLSLVQKLGEAGRLLEDDIKNFLEGKLVIQIDPARLAGLIQQSIDERERRVVVTINPKHIRGIKKRRNPILIGRIQKREGSAITSMSTLRKKKKDELSPEIRHERFKAD